MNSPKNIPGQIRQRCAAQDMPFAELAHRAGINRKYLSNLVCGSRGTPRIDTLQKIAQVLGCTVDELLEPVK